MTKQPAGSQETFDIELSILQQLLQKVISPTQSESIMIFIRRMKENSLVKNQIIELAGNSIIRQIEKTRKVENLEKEKIILNIKNLFRIFEMLSNPHEAMYDIMEKILTQQSFLNLLLKRCETLKTLNNTK